jgi:hypothetical protein
MYDINAGTNVEMKTNKHYGYRNNALFMGSNETITMRFYNIRRSVYFRHVYQTNNTKNSSFWYVLGLLNKRAKMF